MAALTINIKSRTKDSFNPADEKGPPPAKVPQTANPERMSAAVAVSRGPLRIAVQTSGMTARKAIVVRWTVCSITGLKAMSPMPAATTKMLIASLACARAGRPSAHSTRTGATISAPARSPSHQVVKIGPNCAHAAEPPRLRLDTPIAGLIAVAAALISANFAIPAGVVKVNTPPDHRLINETLTRHSRLLPAAMAAAV